VATCRRLRSMWSSEGSKLEVCRRVAKERTWAVADEVPVNGCGVVQ
jgi:hypothetical protein